ncbi:acyl-CoA carboxylase epsilon subunit [Streptomyces sp. NPDC127069]|uniref:acyl-CoA carboxylase epsilon subunit n=1 Tax=Streptomyces sp. NPDC127069 TaxID=3347128 RepID=UPI003666FAD5
MDTSRGHTERGAPLFRVVRGEPGPEELAALTAVLLARTAGPAEPAPATSAPGRRGPRRRGRYTAPGAWRRTA